MKNFHIRASMSMHTSEKSFVYVCVYTVWSIQTEVLIIHVLYMVKIKLKLCSNN